MDTQCFATCNISLRRQEHAPAGAGKLRLSATGVRHNYLKMAIVTLSMLLFMPLALPMMTEAASLPIRGSLPRAQFDESQVVVKKRPAIPFKPRALKDPGTRKQVKQSDMITLPNGRKVQAGAYYEALNRLERNMNKLGYSTRDPRPAGQKKRKIDIQEIPINKALFDNQGNNIQRRLLPPSALKNAPIDLKNLPLLNQKFEGEVRALQGIKSRGIPDAPAPEEKAEFLRDQNQALADQALAEQLESDAALGAGLEGKIPEAILEQEAQAVRDAIEESGQVTTRGIEAWTAEDQENLSQWRKAAQLSLIEGESVEEEGAPSATSPQDDGVTSRGFSRLKYQRFFNKNQLAVLAQKYNYISRPPKPTNPKSTSKSKSWNWNLGNNTFGASFKGQAGYSGFSTRVKVNGDAQAGGKVLGSNVTLASANGSVNVPETGNMTSALQLTVVGVTVLNLSKSTKVAWSKSQSVSKTFNKSTPNITIMVGPIPLKVKAGVRGKAGLAYTIGFRPVRAYATLRPSADVSGYAQAGVGADLLILSASAGVRGTLVLIKVATTATADIALKVVSTTPTVMSRGVVPGRVVIPTRRWAYQSTFAVYVDLKALEGKIDLYAEVTYPCFPDVWNECGDEWTHKLFGWSGFTHRGYLVNESQTINL